MKSTGGWVAFQKFFLNVNQLQAELIKSMWGLSWKNALVYVKNSLIIQNVSHFLTKSEGKTSFSHSMTYYKETKRKFCVFHNLLTKFLSVSGELR